VSTTGLVDTKQQPDPTKRRQYSEALKPHQMVAETQAPGALVSIVARRHDDVNSNQLFRWRRQLLPKAVVESGAMVPVAIARGSSPAIAAPRGFRSARMNRPVARGKHCCAAVGSPVSGAVSCRGRDRQLQSRSAKARARIDVGTLR
jgi:transposase-like protein